MLESGEERIQEIREDLQGSESHSMVSRNVLSWAISFYFLEKVYMYIYVARALVRILAMYSVHAWPFLIYYVSVNHHDN